MEMKTLIIILLVYCIFFNKTLENFSTYNSCVSTVAGRMLFQKESLDDAITGAKKQNQCNDQNEINDLKNKLKWDVNNDCARFLDGIKTIDNPDEKSAKNWFNTCITPIFKK